MNVKEKTSKLISEYCADDLSTSDFCERYEEVFNFELDKDALRPCVRSKLQDLFDAVVWFSPFEDEVDTIPGYKSAEHIRRKAYLLKDVNWNEV